MVGAGDLVFDSHHRFTPGISGKYVKREFPDRNLRPLQLQFHPKLFTKQSDCLPAKG